MNSKNDKNFQKNLKNLQKLVLKKFLNCKKHSRTSPEIQLKEFS